MDRFYGPWRSPEIWTLWLIAGAFLRALIPGAILFLKKPATGDKSMCSLNRMKKLSLVIAVLVGLGTLATPRAEAFVAINIGVPVPPFAYVGAPYAPYYYGYYSYPVFGFWPGGYWHGQYWSRGYYNRYGYGRHAYAHRYHR